MFTNQVYIVYLQNEYTLNMRNLRYKCVAYFRTYLPHTSHILPLTLTFLFFFRIFSNKKKTAGSVWYEPGDYRYACSDHAANIFSLLLQLTVTQSTQLISSHDWAYLRRPCLWNVSYVAHTVRMIWAEKKSPSYCIVTVTLVIRLSVTTLPAIPKPSLACGSCTRDFSFSGKR